MKKLLLFSLMAIVFLQGCKQEVKQEGLSGEDTLMF